MVYAHAMKKIHFPYIAFGLGGLLMMFVIKGSELDADGQTLIPLLTLLIFNECAFILAAIGVYIGLTNYKQAENRRFYLLSTGGCALLAVLFLLQGIKLWPL